MNRNPLLDAPDLLRDLPRALVPVGELMPSLAPRMRREDPAHVRLLAETDNGSDPLLVHRSTMRIIDGGYRLSAALMRGRTEVVVQFFDGSEADAFVLSVQLNVRHGLPLTLDERKDAATRIVASHPHWSDRAIAERTGLSAKTVGKVRSRATAEAPHLDSGPGSRLGRDGKARPVSSVEGRRSAAALLVAHPGISLRELSRRSGISVGTVRDVRERLDRGQDPIPDRLRGSTVAQPVQSPAHLPAVRGEAGPPQTRATTALVLTHRPRGEHEAAVTDEMSSVVRKLVRDPSLRATESGRWLLRMLLASEMDRSQWEEVAEAIPAHCVPLIRSVVLRRCEDWQKLASMVPRKPGRAG
jgi:transposase